MEFNDVNARADEESAKNQLQELINNLKAEKIARAKAEKSTRELSKELESIRSELEGSIYTTTATQEMRQIRELELIALKKSAEKEALAHEVAMSKLKQKHVLKVEELNEQLETTTQYKATLEKATNHLEKENSQLRAEVGELTTWKTEAERKVEMLEDQIAEANTRLTDDEQHFSELQNVKVNMQKELEAANAQVVESNNSAIEGANGSLELEAANAQVMETNDSAIEGPNASLEAQLPETQSTPIQEMSALVATISQQGVTNREGPGTESGAERRSYNRTGRKVHKCTICNNCFSNASNLSRHKRIHTGEKPFKCTQCQKCFARSSDFKVHERVHIEKPFHCTQCQHCFRDASCLEAHKRKRCWEKPFHCTQCSKSYRHNKNLQIHERVHSGEQPFKCTECQKCCRDACNLQAHKRKHSGEKPFKCTECQKCFSGASSLRDHKQRNHSNVLNVRNALEMTQVYESM